MNSTLTSPIPQHIGADLTDRYSQTCRRIDVCGLSTDKTNPLAARFWVWQWDAGPGALDVSVVADELNAARVAMFDGSQGLASIGKNLRACERQSAAVGKTGDSRPPMTRPFAGFIHSSLDVFAALRQKGVEISPDQCLGGVSEVYPGHIWMILSGRRALPNKSTEQGRLARKKILEGLGVLGLQALPIHDQNDACVAALLAATADGRSEVRWEFLQSPQPPLSNCQDKTTISGAIQKRYFEVTRGLLDGLPMTQPMANRKSIARFLNNA